jgi:histidyl-tRNA synthetase
MGVERLLALMPDEAGSVIAAPDVYLVHSGADATPLAWRTAEQMRSDGLDVVFHCGAGNFKTQMKRADASGARFAVIIGDNEAAAGRVSLKPLRELKDQQSVTVKEAIDLIRGPHALRVTV